MKLIARYIFITLAIGLMGYIFYHKVAPLGVIAKVDTEDSEEKITLGPKERVSIGDEQTQRMLSDIVYFSTNMSYQFDHANVKVTFKNSSASQPLSVGFQDQEIWHYGTKLIDVPFLNNSNWIVEGEDPSIFQKNKKYSSLSELLADSSNKDEIVGTYQFDQNIFRESSIVNYKPSVAETVIDTPFRGKITFFTYVNGEMFNLKVSKQDLNIYEDPDVVTVKIYKENDVVYTGQIDDDGITDVSGKVLSPLEATIQNPGPGLPEPGIYKVVIEASTDTVITKLVTNLNKLVFVPPLFPVSNHEVYPKIVKKTRPNKFLTDAVSLSFETYHPTAEQEIKIGTQSAQLKVKEELIATPSAEATSSAHGLTEITLPKSDVVVKGRLGYFAFSPEQFFQPTRYKLQTIDSKEDLEGVDYIIADYTPSWQEGEWRVAEAEFDLSTAFVKNGKLSWLIKAPGLKENGNEVIIKKIEVELSKKPLIKF